MARSYRFAAIVLLAFWSAVVTLSFHRHGQPFRVVNQIDLVVGFESPKPWVTRVFTTLLVHAIDNVTPSGIRDRISDDSTAALIAARLMRNGDLLRNGMAVYGIDYLLTGFAFLLIYAALVGILARDLALLPPVWCLVAAVLSLVTLPPFFVGGFGYIYDFPQLAFAAALVYLIHRGWTLAYLAVFALACLNKETTILFTAVYAFYNWRKESPARLAAMSAVQVAIATIIYLKLQSIFAANGGVPVEHYWIDQFNFLLAPNNWPGLVTILPMIFLLAIGLRGAHRMLKSVFMLALPLSFLFLYGGWPGEYRVFLEMWPILIVVWTLALYRIYETVHAVEAWRDLA